MSKFSVKKPFTVFVAVVAIIVLGVVAYTKMTPDLMPNMNLPYVMVMTTYPGATPEKWKRKLPDHWSNPLPPWIKLNPLIPHPAKTIP